jgi:hypothetical protein
MAPEFALGGGLRPCAGTSQCASPSLAALIYRVLGATRMLVEWDNSTDSQVVRGLASRYDFPPEWGNMGVVATRGPHINDGGWGACWDAFDAEIGSCVAFFFHSNQPLSSVMK